MPVEQDTPEKHQPGFVEFVALMATMTAIVAVSIDAMLPALPEIGNALGVQRENANQLIISVLFLGLAAGQLFFGPLSDSIGRKRAIYAGYLLYIGGCVLSLVSMSFPVMLLGRVLQGLGMAGPRSVTLALVRDRYAGRAMAQVMSFVMAVFILIPVIAPSLGQAVLHFWSWRAIFVMYLLMALGSLIWFGVRQPETLAEERRVPFAPGRIGRAMQAVVSDRIALGYTITAGLMSGAFLGYLNSAQQIFQVQYGLGDRFPLFFATVALAIGTASFTNSQLVMRFGMRALAGRALFIIAGLSSAFLMIGFMQAGQPPLWSLMVYLMLTFFCVGILNGNLNALAMEPLGHIAGVGAAVVGSLSTFLSMALGIVIGQSYNNTILPLVGGFAVLSLASLVTMQWAERNRIDDLLGEESMVRAGRE